MSDRVPGGVSRRPGPHPNQRGMVTVELAIGSVLAVVITACLVSLAMLGVAQSACAESSAQIARQVARGDDAAVREARKRAPGDARVDIVREDMGVTVTVRVSVRVLGVGNVGVGAEAWAAYEPGQGP